MVVKTLFRHGRLFEPGEVEISLLPGIPNLHIVGLPDAQIKECGIRLKSALRACGLKWPQGQQIVVNLRPNHFRKSGSGVDLAVALGFLAETEQLNDSVLQAVRECLIYGEVGLDGQISRPFDADRAIRFARTHRLLTGVGAVRYGDGEWLEMKSLADQELGVRKADQPLRLSFSAPERLDFELPLAAVTPLLLALHMRLHVLLAGPQGSGKSTWAQILYSLTTEPDHEQMRERFDFFPQDVESLRWRPFEQPHHTITAQAMVGGGLPVEPGVITRAHGGVLLMDEFLEFPGAVLEALREPLENGMIEIARKGAREKLPADFQLIATTNLCPCGKLNPQVLRSCSRTLGYCRSVCDRLSGPLLDRFDLMLLTADWLGAKAGPRLSMAEIEDRLHRVRKFAIHRGPMNFKAPDWLHELEHSYRRKRSLLRVARGLADLEESVEITPFHVMEAGKMVVDPISKFSQFFA